MTVAIDQITGSFSSCMPRMVPSQICSWARGVSQHAGLREHLRVVQGAEHPQHAGDAQQEAEVTDAVDQERLHVGEDRGRALEPEADQQVRHQAHRFPAEEQLQLLLITRVSIEKVNSEM